MFELVNRKGPPCTAMYFLQQVSSAPDLSSLLPSYLGYVSVHVHYQKAYEFPARNPQSQSQDTDMHLHVEAKTKQRS